MRKSPKATKQTQTAQPKSADIATRSQQRQETASRRGFLKTAGLAAAVAMTTKPLKAMISSNKGWLQAVELSQLADYPDTCSLNIEGWETQNCDCWCWAATVENIWTYYDGVDVPDQCDIANDALDANCSAGPDASECCDSDCDAKCNDYGGFGGTYGGTCGSTDFEDVADYICNHGPVVAYIGECTCNPGNSQVVNNDGTCSWGGCEGDDCSVAVDWAHYVTIFGYWTEFEPGNDGYWYFDPSPGEGPTSDYVSNFPGAEWWSAIYT